MNKRNMSTVEASLYVLGIFFVIVLILAAFGVGGSPKCAQYGCDNDVSHNSDYCFLHNSRNYYSNSYKKRSSTASSNHSSGSNSSSGSNYSSSGSNSSSQNTSSSTNNKKYNSNNSYDDGYDDVYMDDDYDWDRYWEDDDYASGVDDALEDMDDGDW